MHAEVAIYQAYLLEYDHQTVKLALAKGLV